MKKIEGLSLKDLKDLLGNLNLYRKLEKQLWSRWVDTFKRSISWKDSFVVEYSHVWEEFAGDKALEVYKNSFNASPSKQDIKFIEADYLDGWMKVYFNDSMIDVSFSKFEKIMKS